MSKPTNQHEVAQLFIDQRIENGSAQCERVLNDTVSADTLISPHNVYTVRITRKQVGWMRKMGMDANHLQGNTYYADGSFADGRQWQLTIVPNGSGILKVYKYDDISERDKLVLEILRRWYHNAMQLVVDSKAGEWQSNYHVRAYRMYHKKMIDLGYIEPTVYDRQEFEYNSDCPYCLRGQFHEEETHHQALNRVYSNS